MTLNLMIYIRQATILSGFTLVITSVAAQTITPPSKLSGRWTTVDGASSQSISANIDAATSKGTLTVWSNASDCTIRDAPIAVTSVGEKLILKVDPSYTNPCRADVSVELTKKASSDDYEGELRQGGPAGARFPILRVKMSP
jgi:hypothetical protein